MFLLFGWRRDLATGSTIGPSRDLATGACREDSEALATGSGSGTGKEIWRLVLLLKWRTYTGRRFSYGSGKGIYRLFLLMAQSRNLPAGACLADDKDPTAILLSLLGHQRSVPTGYGAETERTRKDRVALLFERQRSSD